MYLGTAKTTLAIAKFESVRAGQGSLSRVCGVATNLGGTCTYTHTHCYTRMRTGTTTWLKVSQFSLSFFVLLRSASCFRASRHHTKTRRPSALPLTLTLPGTAAAVCRPRDYNKEGGGGGGSGGGWLPLCVYLISFK